MTRRSRAREVALQLLFQRDHNPQVSRSVIERFLADRLREPALRPFCQALFDGIVANLADIDARLAEAAENWRLSRMAGVDRNVLRIGAYEILHNPDTPPSVALDEAIELARRFGSADSPKFVNGVLDKLRINAEKKESGVGSQESEDLLGGGTQGGAEVNTAAEASAKPPSEDTEATALTPDP